MKNFIVIFLLSFLEYGVFGADEIKEVTEGDSLTLPTGLTKAQSNDVIYWLYGSDKAIIAEISSGNFQTRDDSAEGIFKGKLELDKQTGSLTIKDIRIKNSGDYHLNINRGTTTQKFSVTVYARLPTPAIGFSECAPKPARSSSPKCILQCSVQTVGLVTLSWYKGNIFVSSRVSDTCNSFSLRLEVDSDDKNTFSCMVSNRISNQTKHQDIGGLCHPCAVVSDPGVSPGAAAGIVVVVVLLVAAAVAGGYFYYRPKITNLPSQTWSKFPGDNVTLNPDTEIQTGDEIQWRFGAEDTPIAEIKKETGEINTYDGPDMIFKGKLTLDWEDGSLTIKCINTDHSGLYTLKIRRGRETLYKKIQLSMDVKCEAVFVGNSVCLLTGLTEIQKDDEIQWIFRDKNQQTLIAKIKRGIPNTYDGPDEIFKDSLELEKQTGNLIIKNSTFKHAGCYEVKIRSSKGDTNKTFFVIIRGGFNVYNEDMYMMEEQEETVEYDEGIVRDSVHLLSGLTKIQTHDEIQWLFKHEKEETLIATIKRGIPNTYDGPDGIFKDSLQLETRTGDLIIKDSELKHAGCYKVKIRSSKGDTKKIKTFFVIIRDGEDHYVDVSKWSKKTDNEDPDVNVNEEDTGKPLLRVGVGVDVVNEQEGTSSL